MVRRVTGWALMMFVVWSATPVAAQTNSPLKSIPGDAAVVIKIKGITTSIGKIAALADAVQPGSGNTVKFSSGFIQSFLKNPTMDGVDTTGDFYIALFMDKENPQPGVVFIAPAKNLDDMQETLGEEVTFVKADKYGIYTEVEELGDAIKEQIKSKEEDSLADAIDEASLAVIARGDLSIFVNVPTLLETYKDELEMAKGQIENIKDQRPDNPAPGINWEAMMERLQGLATELVGAVEDHEGITLAFSFTDKDIVIENLFKVDDESETAKKLKNEAGGTMPLLAGLPADSMGYYGLQVDMSKLIAAASDWATAVVQDEKALAAMNSAMKEISGVKFTGAVGSFDLAPNVKSGALRLTNVIGVSDPQKLRALSKKYAAEVKSMEANGVKTEISLKTDAEKVGTTPIDITTSKITISDDAPNAEQQRKTMDFLYGAEGTTARSAFLKDRMIQTIGGGKPAIEAAIKANEAKAATLPTSLQSVKAKLGTKLNFVGFIDLAKAVSSGVNIAKDTVGDQVPFDLSAVTKGLDLKSSYTGVGLEVQKSAVSIKTVIPVEQIKGLVKMGMNAQKAQAGASAE